MRRIARLSLLLASAATALAHPRTDAPKIEDAQVRETLPGKEVTAAFLAITNTSAEEDALVGASCAAAKTVEMHRMATRDGMMTMERVSEIALPAGVRTELRPGGLHLMLFGLTRPLRAGGSVRLTLEFRRADPITIEVPVRSVMSHDAQR